MLTAPMHAFRSQLCQAALVLTLALAGCAGGATRMASQTPPLAYQPEQLDFILPIAQRLLHPSPHLRSIGRALPVTGSSFVATSEFFGSDAAIYTSAARQLTYLEQVTTGLASPVGMSITPSGTWYITNSKGQDVAVYSLTKDGVSGPTGTLSDPAEIPIGVASNALGSLVAVSNSSTTASGMTGSVSLYSGGSTDPTGTLHAAVPNVTGIGIAMDGAGDCFWSYDNSKRVGVIVEFPLCAGKPKVVVSGLTFAGAIAFDRVGNMFYTDQALGTVYRCVKKARCKPLSAGYADPFGLNFDAGWKHLWLTDVGMGVSGGSDGMIYALDPKTGAMLSATPAQGDPGDPPFGVAAAPGPAY